MSRYKVNQTTGELEALIAGAEEIDGALSSTSTKAVQNKVVKAAIDDANNAIATAYKRSLIGNYKQADVSTVTITASPSLNSDDVLYLCVIHDGGNQFSFGIMSRIYDVNLDIPMLGNTNCKMQRLSSNSFSITVPSAIPWYKVVIIAPEKYTFTVNT